MTDDVSRLTKELAQAVLRDRAPKVIKETMWLIAEASAAIEISDFYRLYLLLTRIENNSQIVLSYIPLAEALDSPKLVALAQSLVKELDNINL
jgi:hypothetical protein